MLVDMSELCHSFPDDDTCTTRYVHVLYVGCGRGKYVGGEPMYKGCGRLCKRLGCDGALE